MQPQGAEPDHQGHMLPQPGPLAPQDPGLCLLCGVPSS